MSEKIWIILGGLLAGFVNGLLGTGGGIILVFLLGKVLKNVERKDVFATTLMVTLVLSVVSTLMYLSKGVISFSADSISYFLSAGVGGYIGAYLLERLSVGVVKKVFGVLVIIAGAGMAGVI